MLSEAGGPIVLIAERDVFMRRALEKTLSSGFQLEFASTGTEAVEKARRLKPALVILEILLPEMDGFQVCRALREDPETSNIPLLVFSMLDVEQQALRAGADAFLYKPLRKKDMLETIERLLVGRQNGETNR